MIFPLFRRDRRDRDTISTLYGTIVAQARLPCFYRDYAVADTVYGRFDLLLLHVSIILDRMATDAELRELGQRLFDRFCQDMDNNLREMGVGDLAVPKQMQRVGEAFYGRAQAYRNATEAGDTPALIEAVLRNIYGGVAANPAAPGRLAAYILEAAQKLKEQTAVRILSGEMYLPDPAAVIVEVKPLSSED